MRARHRKEVPSKRHNVHMQPQVATMGLLMVSGGRTWWYDASVPGVQLIYNKTAEWPTKVGENNPSAGCIQPLLSRPSDSSIQPAKQEPLKWKKDVRAYTEIPETIDRPTEQRWTMMQCLRSRYATWDVSISNVLRFAKARTCGSSERWEATIAFFYCLLGTPDARFVRRWRSESKRMG